MTQYRKNYIKEAILRIDYKNTINDFIDSLDEDLKNEVLKKLPTIEVKDSFIETISVNSLDVKKERINFKEWHFLGNEGTKRICITKDFFYISVTRYINDSDFIEPFMQVLKIIGDKYPDFHAKRVGMRYINQIQLDEPNSLSWENFINQNYISIFNIPEKNNITRAFHNLELNFEDENINLKMQYGMHNPDFPSKIKQKLFVLDLDASKVGDLAIDELEHIIPILHEKILRLFEESITDGLRRKMNE